MDQQGHGQPPGTGVGSSAQMQYGVPAYQANQMMGSTPPASAGTIQSPQAAGLSSSPAQLAQHQLAYQQIHQQQQQQLQQQLQSFWANQYQEIEQVTDFKNHSLPLARIKKIMKADEDVRMISAEAPVIFARACEMFILELTLRSWNHTEENKRRTLQKNDIAAAITRTDIFDFLVDIVPREDLKDEVLAATIPRGPLPGGGPAEGLPYYYMPPQHAAQVGSSGFQFSMQPEKFTGLRFHGTGGSRRKIEYLSENGGSCDVFEGDWVWDESYPLYQSKDCKFLDDGFRCSENGRPDSFYTKWRWQPKACNLPRFDAKLMLEKLRNKRLVFVGDSIGRNQWESLLCMLSSVVANKGSIYEVNGKPITKHKGFLVFKFEDYNCTVEYYRAPFLVSQGRPPAKSPPNVRSTLKLDQVDWSYLKWRHADILVFNTGHWWNFEKTTRMGCYFQEGREVKMEMQVDAAYRKSLETVMGFIKQEVNTSKTRVIFRTYSPVHFRGGDWRNGGGCHEEKLPELGTYKMPSHSLGNYNIFKEVLSSPLSKSYGSHLEVLDVSNMTLRRKDGHSSIYYRVPQSSRSRQDCSHWCLPGVPDSWNELLYALFLKREASLITNSSKLWTTA